MHLLGEKRPSRPILIDGSCPARLPVPRSTSWSAMLSPYDHLAQRGYEIVCGMVPDWCPEHLDSGRAA